MKIGVEAGCLGVKDKRLKVGVYNVAVNLLAELSKKDKENEYLLYSFYPIDKLLLKSFGRNMKNVVVGPSFGWTKIWLPLRLFIDRPRVFIGLSQAFPKFYSFSKSIYKILLVYDLAFEKYPEMYLNSFVSLHKNTKSAVEITDTIIAVSHSTKKDLIDLYRIKEKRITVSYPGIKNIFSKKAKKYKSRNSYFLFVGSLKKGKNITGLIKAFGIFAKLSRKNYVLIIVGGDKWLDNDIRIGLDKVKFLGYVNDDKLASLYRGAEAFLSPSFYEGFGLTFLEAMACGCPVIASNRGSISEVVGDAGILADPNDVDALTNAMLKISTDGRLRKDMIEKGLIQSKMFSREKFAKDVYDEIKAFEK